MRSTDKDSRGGLHGDDDEQGTYHGESVGEIARHGRGVAACGCNAIRFLTSCVPALCPVGLVLYAAAVPPVIKCPRADARTRRALALDTTAAEQRYQNTDLQHTRNADDS